MSSCCGPEGAADDPGRIADDLGGIEIEHEPGCHNAGGLPEPDDSDRRVRVALIGSPNAGKTSVFNALTGLRMKTGNYPGVTVTRTVGRVTIKTPALVGAGAPAKPVKSYAYLEDLPGAYSLTPISPDEKVVADLLHGELAGIRRPDAALVIVDATVLERSLSLVAETLNLGIPVAVVLTMTDEMELRGGHVDAAGLERALGIPVRAVIGTRSSTLEPVRKLLADPSSWSRPVVPPPARPGPERNDWVASALAAGAYRKPRSHSTTDKVDRVLLHPVFGTVLFLAIMFGFFQMIFTVAAPLQGYVEEFFGWLGTLVSDHVGNAVVADFLGSAVIGGVGSILVFLPQIMLMFLLISLLENVGYMSRAAFLTDRVMARAGLEGRAFVAMLSSFACAVPGIMAARTLPSTRDRIAVAITAPLTTCSARIPVYILLIGMLIPSGDRFGPFNAQGAAMFGLYLLGGFSALVAAAIFKRTRALRSGLLPFYMEMPPYRLPTLKSVLLSMWDSSKEFLFRVGTIIFATSVVLWILLSLPAHTTEADAVRQDAVAAATAAGSNEGEAAAAGEAAAKSYVMDNSFAASIGKAVEPVFAPLGFDWRIDIGIVGSFAAREVVVSTLGQIAAAEDPEAPDEALAQMRHTDGEKKGELVFTTPTVVAMLLFFAYALQCMSTVGAIRRETNSWRWPIIAWVYMFVLAWVAGFIGYRVATMLGG